MMKEETKLQAQIVKELEKYGLVLRQQVGKYRSLDGKRIVSIGKKGTPDLLYISHTGEIAFIEVKLPHGRLSEEQKEWLHKLTRMGIACGVAKSIEDALSICGILHL